MRKINKIISLLMISCMMNFVQVCADSAEVISIFPADGSAVTADTVQLSAQCSKTAQKAVFILDGVQWNPPEEWTRVTKDRNIEDIEKQLGIDINNNAVLKLNLGGLSCKSWFYADSGDDCPFEERDFYFACCDETDSDSKKVFIYRGHHLYGI